MRTIRVTGGYSDYAVGDLKDNLGHDLSTATLKAMLHASEDDPPAKDDGAWAPPDVITYPVTGSAVVQLLVDEDTAPGFYWLWVQAADNPTAQPVCAADEQVQVV